MDFHNPFSLKGKVSLVTGGGRGIGKAFSLGLAQAGAKVVVVDIHEEEAKETAEAIQTLGRQSSSVRADVTESKDVQEMIKHIVNVFGKLDIAVNNVGGVRSARWSENITMKDFDSTLTLNLRTVFNCAKEEASIMIPKKAGKIINTASISGSIVNSSAAYSAAKAGVIMLTRVLAQEWARYNINVNCISPGKTITPGASWVQFSDSVKKKFISKIPLGRLGQVEDLVGALVFLASDASNYITGINIIVDGGSSLGYMEPESLPYYQDKPKWMT